MRYTETQRIKNYCLGIFDGPHATPKESDDGPIFLGIQNITEYGTLDLSEVRHLSEEEYSRWTRRVTPQPGDVVFTYEAMLHRYAIIPTDFRGCLGRRVALVRPDPEQVDSRYLLYFFLSRAWRQVVESNVMTGATVDRVPLEEIPHFPAILNQHLFRVEPNGLCSPVFLLFALREALPEFASQTVGATMKHIRKSALTTVTTKLPPRAIVTQFDKVARDAYKQALNLRRQNQQLRAARDLLLPRLISGEIAV